MTTDQYYKENASTFFNNTVNLDMTDIYKPFLELVNEGGHILDAGCGSGRDSLYFLEHGYEVTAFDACDELVKLAAGLINRDVLNLRFQEINFEEQFDGIWACASLLHVGRKEIDEVLRRLTGSLKACGVLYASFKYGDKEEMRNGRLFNCYDEQSSDDLLLRHPQMQLIRRWQTVDVRPDRADEKWINLLLQKVRNGEHICRSGYR